MKPWHLALVVLAGSVAAEPGYILLSPDILQQQSTVQMRLLLVDVEGSGDVLISLEQVQGYYSGNTSIIVEKTIQIEEEREVNFNLDIPAITELPNYYAYTYFLQINGTFSNLEISNQVQIQIQKPSFTVLVQTDKPLYKPGQLVQFRVLTIDRDLRPLRGAVGDVWIQDPSGARLANWLNQSFTRGISQYSLQLIDEPPLGFWSIVTVIRGQTFTTTFEVKEYVLPKFDVTITPPPYVLNSDREITWEICATYTYGKPVGGILRLNATYQSYNYYFIPYGFVVPYVYTKVLINGCYNYTLALSSLEDQVPKNQTINYFDSDTIVLTAELSENGTGNVVRADSTVSRYLQLDVSLSFETYLEYFKPGFPTYMTLDVTRPDNTPAPNVPVELCYTSKHDRGRLCWAAESLYMACRNYTSDSEGKIKFGVPMQGQDVTLMTISANYTVPSMVKGQASLSALATADLRGWYSPSQSFIKIQPVKGDLPCGKKTTVSVLFYGNTSEVTIYYQIISKGRLLTHNKAKTCPRCKINLDPDDTFIYAPSSNENIEEGQDPADIQFLRNLDKAFPVPKLTTRLNVVNVTFTPTFDLTPSASLLVYYVRSDGEVVADSVTLSVSRCLKNQAEMKFNTTKDYPGSAVSYELTTQPDSWCGVTAVDSSLYLLSDANRLDISQIYNYLSQLAVQSYIQQQPSPQNCPPPPRCHAKFYLAGKPKKTRSKRSIVVPPPYPPAPSSWNSAYLDSLYAFQWSGTKIITNLNVDPRPCPITVPIGPLPIYTSKDGPIFSKGLLDAATSSGSGTGAGPGTANPAVTNRVYFPETWLWDLVYVPGGKVTQQAKLPDTLTTWEGNAVCVNPKKGIAISASANITGFQPFFVTVTLPYSVIRGEIVPVVVSASNYLDVCLPIRIILDVNEEQFRLADESSSPEARICLCGGEVRSTTIRIISKVIGSINVTASAYSTLKISACDNQNHSTQFVSDTETRVLLVEPEGIPQQITQSALICANDGNVTSIDVSPPDDSNLVPDSVRVYLLVSGDLLGAALQHMDQLVLIPLGTGFTSLVRYQPNILLLRYLEVTGQVNDELKQEALANIRAGYQRMLSFKRYDGSYAPFGNSEYQGSIELTVEVVETNHEASQYIDVDQNDLIASENWVVSQQNYADGCFPVLGATHNSYLRGTHGRSTITALVLSALLEAGFTDNSTSVVSNAISCIKLDATPRVYTLAIAAYTFSLASDEKDARSYLKLLDDKAFYENGYKYWLPSAESDSDGPPDSTMDASSIEVAGFVALTMMRLDGREGIADVLPIIRGLVSKMNVNGGFYSSQDTVVGLKAIIQYSSLLSPEDKARNLDVVFTPGPKTFRVDDTNSLVQQIDRQEGNGTKLEVKASGQGCALVQVQAKYNVLTPPKPVAFNISADVSQGSKNCQVDLDICFSYLLDGLSNIVTMEVRLVSGFEPLLINLDLLLNNFNGVRKYTYSDQVITFYFDSMTSGQTTCLKFTIAKTVDVGDVKPGNIQVMDVYRQDRSATIEYEVGEITCD